VKNWKRYKIEVLTPLHIGSGEKLYPLEYLIEQKEFLRVNMDKLFTETSFDRERFINKSKSRDFYLGNFDRNNALKHSLYKINIHPSTAKELKENIKTRNSFILDFIKEGKNFYIPGSSVKGAIRTTLLWNLLKESEKKELYKKLLMKQLRKNKKPKDFSINAEESILGKPHNSLLKAIHIGDSAFIPSSLINISVSRVITKTNNGFKWKKFGRDRGNTDNPENATPIFFEAIKPGTRIKGSFKINEFLLHPEIAKSLNYKNTELLKEIVTTCNAFSHIHFNEILNEIQRIKNMSLSENEFILHIAWGSGYESKALGNTIDEKLFADIIEKKDLNFQKLEK